MAMRTKVLQAATACLYFGPLLAGLSGFGWAMLMPFVSIFVFWLMMLRPQDWPQRNADWMAPTVLLAVLTQVLTQILLVAVLFGIGRGIGGVTGTLPLFHPFLPLALSFLAVPLSRLVWKGEEALENGVTLDEFLYPRQEPRAAVREICPPDQAIRPLLALADDAPLAEVGPALDDVLDDDAAWARFGALVEALDRAPQRHARLREAMVIWASEPERFASGGAPAALRAAFRTASPSLEALRFLLPRAAALARAFPERHAQFPDRATLESLGTDGLPAQLATDLAALLSALGHRAGSAAPRRAAAAPVAAGLPAT